MLYMLSKSILTFFSSFSPTHRQPMPTHTKHTHTLFLFKNFSLFSSRFGSSSSNYLGLILLNLIYFKLTITSNIFQDIMYNLFSYTQCKSFIPLLLQDVNIIKHQILNPLSIINLVHISKCKKPLIELLHS